MPTPPSCLPAVRALGRWLPALLLLGPVATGRAAQDPLDSLRRALGTYQQRAVAEKLFLHLDRPFYLSGETMWYKVYAVSRPQAFSAVAYVEVLDQANRPVLQAKIPVRQATGHGSFQLPASLASGVYTVRAYTSWMQNFDPAYYFQRQVTVANPRTAADGPATTGPDSVAYDVQFFPEGGQLVQGLRSTVGFKVTSGAGTGVGAQGRLLNQAGTTVASFQTLRYGMGSFSFTPEPGATYTAVVALPGGRVLRRGLPRVYAQGYVLGLEDDDAKPLTLTVRSTSARPETMYLLSHSRQQVALAAQAQLINGQATFLLDRTQLPEGVSRLTVFNAEQKPVAERLFFRVPRQQLVISARPDKPQYAPREPVRLAVATAGAPALPAPGASLSVAVYRLDSLATGPTPDIGSYLWLASEVPGTVEHPEYYLTATGPEAAAATNNLLLTQGWSRFRWEDVRAPTPPAFPYPPELYGPIMRARLTQVGTTQPAPGLLTYLSVPSRIIRLQSGLSNAAGLVQFELPEVYGPGEVMVQTNPRQDSTCRIELLNPFSERYPAAPVPAFVPLAQYPADYTKRYFQQQVQRVFANPARGRYRLPPADSTAFYGKADETYLLDRYTRFKVLEEVMREYVPGVLVRRRKDGFHFMVVDRINQTTFTEDPMVLLDGVPVFNLNKLMALDPLKIQKLEVITSRYFHGPALYSGLVSFTTYKGDLEGFPLDPRVLVQQYEGLQGQREFYAPRYDTPEARRSRLPDLRNLLYWNPSVTATGSGAQQLEFYTGDQAGRYLVVVQGLSATGLPGSTSFTFEVKQPL
ncbi:hypothetical protein HNQ93_003094 [Hymenobacter luteus]|uniref:Macroglobulin domain-containing protein n=2 Tax=Hymenobacter TaxID=89966 RepID=A0A7W9T3T8_9BACT|nr:MULTISPECIES: hypothetical protein [Hymenobacter]MBB4602336.1 hypothetical protein [Hymenobacter latericoloratus]MBB6060228.1 hypothetical protein [Hymenobacter luteus]